MFCFLGVRNVGLVRTCQKKSPIKGQSSGHLAQVKLPQSHDHSGVFMHVCVSVCLMRCKVMTTAGCRGLQTNRRSPPS